MIKFIYEFVIYILIVLSLPILFICGSLLAIYHVGVFTFMNYPRMAFDTLYGSITKKQ
jgi:hypothetical protein